MSSLFLFLVLGFIFYFFLWILGFVCLFGLMDPRLGDEEAINLEMLMHIVQIPFSLAKGLEKRQFGKTEKF